jgi:hypothetical protein
MAVVFKEILATWLIKWNTWHNIPPIILMNIDLTRLDTLLKDEWSDTFRITPPLIQKK